MSDWFDAAEAGDEAAMVNLRRLGLVTNVDEVQDGQTALFVSAGLAHPSVVRFLLSESANPSFVDSNGHTVLMAAAHGGSGEVISLLLADGVDITTKDNEGKTAFDYAKLTRKKDALMNLLAVGATPGREKTVLVLGAGFTKAFLPAAPLLLDNYGMEGTLTRKYRELEYANDILQDELARTRPFGAGNVDLERLMTRLDGGMPYDESHSAVNQLRSLLDDVKLSFLSKLNSAKSGTFHQAELDALARKCINNKITIITFNYDDILDKAIHEAAVGLNTRWSPNRGYGFFCRSSYELEGKTFGHEHYAEPHTTILKIHGSVNWRTLIGTNTPIKSNDIFHHSKWFSSGAAATDAPFDALETQFQAQPFIVPPVLTKASLTQQPVLQLLWSRAYDALSEADRVIFVGYSLPVTDIASSTLFKESMFMMPHHPQVEVVGFAANADDQETLKAAYRRVFPSLDDSQFRFDGGLAWAATFAPPPPPVPTP